MPAQFVKEERIAAVQASANPRRCIYAAGSPNRAAAMAADAASPMA
jgi:hypothetical protein